MAKSIHLFRLFYESPFDIKIPIPKTLIKGYGFDKLTYMFNDNGLILFSETEKNKVPKIVETWKQTKEDHAVIKINNKSQKFSSIIQLMESFVIQEFLSPAENFFVFWNDEKKITVTWDKLSQDQFKEIKSHVTIIKRLINSEIESTNMRINKLSLCYIYSKEKIYLLGIDFYSYEGNATKSLQSFPELKMTKNSVIRRVKNKKISIKEAIENKIKEITKNEDSIKSISYKSWIDKVNKGEKLFANENLFARRIAKNKSLSQRNSTKCIKELKGMAIKMRISMAENKSKERLTEGIRKSLEENILLPHSNFVIKSMSKNDNIKRPTPDTSLQSVQNLMEKSINDLKNISKTHRYSF